MVIGKMNSIFHRHGRWMFGVITLLIIVSFVGFLTPGFLGTFNSLGGEKTYGVVFGQKVTLEDIRTQSSRNMIAYSMVYGVGMNNNKLSEMASGSAFPVICRLAAAKRRGVTVSDKEIVDFILKLPAFKNPKTGKFDKALYRRYMDDTLRPNGFTAADLDTSVREFLVMRKLDKEIMDATIVTPGEVRQFYNQYREQFKTYVAHFNASDYLGKVKLKDVELKNYFNHHLTQFTMPAKFKALVVVFKHDTPAIVKAAKAGINAAALQKYYDSNKQRFTEYKPGQPPKVKPFAKVKNQVGAMLLRQRCRELAFKEAQVFAQDVYDQVGEAGSLERLKMFKNFAAEKKCETFIADWFSADSKTVGKFEEPQLAAQIAAIYDIPVSNAVNGENAAYVAFLTEKIASRPAKFNEVSLRVIKLVKAEKAMRLARAAARETVAKISKIKLGMRMNAVKLSKNPVFKKQEPFFAANPPYGRDGSIISALAGGMSAGDIGAENTVAGAIAVFLAQRVLPDDKEFAKNKAQVEYFYQQKKYAAAQAAFENWLQSKCKQMGN